ncbi:hypothetical protein BELL_0289g00080 [Botrytis elliptica]|uniref:Uncharacterized protein n=1 Tax=Botrytis elliptica TaxID=278938 RepID=A0A4Z1JLK3_9HELO|nr:hypothetical protein BELL_0289g00080 [Botrytis elliptica]
MPQKEPCLCIVWLFLIYAWQGYYVSKKLAVHPGANTASSTNQLMKIKHKRNMYHVNDDCNASPSPMPYSSAYPAIGNHILIQCDGMFES